MAHKRMIAFTASQEKLLFEVGNRLIEAGVDFVLIGGPVADGRILSNVCPHCAADMLTGALAGAVLAAERPDEGRRWLQ